jgi:Galactose oxidase-like, Early set domain/Glyoxal oxidase N-terminus/Divergent InlB B-repeat domain
VGSVAAVAVAASVLCFLFYGCGQEPTDPSGLSTHVRYNLTIGAGSSSASGTVTSNLDGISCAIVGATGGADASGACIRSYEAGTVVSMTAIAAAGSVLKLDAEWGTTCIPNVEDRRVCQVTMNGDHTVAPTFVPVSNSFTLAVSGGAGGNGTVFSNPIGITCTITDGQVSSGNCSAGFPRGTRVKLTAKTARGRRLKAWAGGGCETAGDGTGTTSGSCTTTVARNVDVVVSFDAQGSGVAGTMGQWDAPITWPAVAINAALLPNRRVLTYSRHDHVPVLWNPANPGSFTDLTLPADIFCSGLALLRDGRLQVTGGHSGVDNYGIKTTYRFDYLTNQWARGTDMRNGRWYPTNTTLPNGQLLTISGGDTAGKLNRIPEVYAPGTDTWRALTAASRSVPYYPMMFVAPNGKVFYVGPEQATAFLSTTGTGTWTPGPPRNCCYRDYGSAAMYDAGKILVVGGGDTPTSTAEAIDLTGASTWNPAGSMAVARRQLNATLLADGKVLVSGGTNASGFNNAPTSSAVLAAELWDPAKPGVWTPLSSMSHYRLYHSTALLLPDARVLSVGSGQPAATGLTDDYTAEIFSPPYLFNQDGTLATRPVISSAPTSVTYAQAFTVNTASAASITKVTWIRLSAVTHSFNQNQRMNVLSFSPGAGAITVTAPLNANLAPPGHYMLFIVKSNGVPSVAKVIRIH